MEGCEWIANLLIGIGYLLLKASNNPSGKHGGFLHPYPEVKGITFRNLDFSTSLDRDKSICKVTHFGNTYYSPLFI